jgi:response regulator RpfG family c-di-GMP phosphodiesterase
LDLLTHYVIPRLLSIIIIDILLSGIGSRNFAMLEKQKELAEKAGAEMRKRNELQSVVIENLSSLIESRDENTGEHVLRTKDYVGLLAREMERDEAFRGQLSADLIEEIENAAPLHDIGKIAVSDVILNKPGRLTEEEFEKMKKHTTAGAEIIEQVISTVPDSAYLREAKNLAEYHHEKWNGRGYPHGLSGEDIPLSARIMAVADVFDALVSERCYKKAFSFDDAMDIIQKDAGSHFDPKVAEAFLSAELEVRQVAEHFTVYRVTKGQTETLRKTDL